MSLSSLMRVRFGTTLVVAVALLSSAWTFANENEKVARLATYDSRDGETTFALSLIPTVSAKPRPSDVLIMVDTSASQNGQFRDDSLETLRGLLEQLDDQDRVKIFAVDIDAVALTDTFVSPTGDAATAAIKKLNDRLPMGATDLPNALKQAAEAFQGEGRNRNVIYIGDGVTRGFGGSKQFGEIVKGLTGNQVAVSSFAIGPQRDIEMMAALANQTGGSIFVDVDDIGSVSQAVKGLSETVRGTVFWPSEVNLPSVVKEVFPATMPPLRTDRDTIVIGTLAERGSVELTMRGDFGGQPVTMKWPVKAEESDDFFAFLPALVQSARQNSGLTLPTVGSAGLREAARVMMASTAAMARMDAEFAANREALEGTEINASSRQPQEDDQPQEDQQGEDGDVFKLDGTPAEATDGGETQEPEDKLQVESDDDFLQTERKRRDAAIGRLRSEVRNVLTRSREEMSASPDRAISMLKDMAETIERDPILDSASRAELRSQLENQLLEASRRKYEFEERIAMAQQRDQMRVERERLRREMTRREEKIASLMNRFDALMEEKNYTAAREIPLDVIELDPNSVEAPAASEYAGTKSNFEKIWELRRRRQVAVLDTLYQTEKAQMPFPGDPPLIFPDPEVWAEKVEARRKYQSVRLSGNAAEEEILEKLNELTDFDYTDTPFSEVIEEINQRHGINIYVDEEAGLTEEDEVSIRLKGVQLKSALKLLLRKYDSTYVVKDQVLQIMSTEQARRAVGHVRVQRW